MHTNSKSFKFEKFLAVAFQNSRSFKVPQYHGNTEI